MKLWIDLLSGVVKVVKDFDPTNKLFSAFYADYKRINSILPVEIAEICKEVDICGYSGHMNKGCADNVRIFEQRLA